MCTTEPRRDAAGALGISSGHSHDRSNPRPATNPAASPQAAYKRRNAELSDTVRRSAVSPLSRSPACRPCSAGSQLACASASSCSIARKASAPRTRTGRCAGASNSQTMVALCSVTDRHAVHRGARVVSGVQDTCTQMHGDTEPD